MFRQNQQKAEKWREWGKEKKQKWLAKKNNDKVKVVKGGTYLTIEKKDDDGVGGTAVDIVGNVG